MSFGKKIGFFQDRKSFGTAVSVAKTVDVSATLSDDSTVVLTISNAELPNTNIAYEFVGVDSSDFVDNTLRGELALDATGNATLTKTIVTSGTDQKSFFLKIATVNNRITGQSSNVNIDLQQPFDATGGILLIENNNAFHVFTTSGNITFNQMATGLNREFRALVVASGGDGGNINFSTAAQPGGGGGGGVIDANVSADAVSINTFDIIVGGNSTVNNGNTSFLSYTAVKGGKGAGDDGVSPGGDGGSGGGGQVDPLPTTPYGIPTAGGSGISGQGFAGAAGTTQLTGDFEGSRLAGGGGGAGEPGKLGAEGTGGAGGDGKFVSWVADGFAGDLNFPKYFGGGGGGRGTFATGSRGKGSGNSFTSPTGGGGEGGGNANSKPGRPGVVIVSYPLLETKRYLDLA